MNEVSDISTPIIQVYAQALCPYDKAWFPEALYLLAMVDYLSRENDLPLCTNYNDIRAQKLKTVAYPSGILALYAVTRDKRCKEESLRAAIPEFRRFNIVENEVRKGGTEPRQ